MTGIFAQPLKLKILGYLNRCMQSVSTFQPFLLISFPFKEK